MKKIHKRRLYLKEYHRSDEAKKKRKLSRHLKRKAHNQASEDQTYGPKHSKCKGGSNQLPFSTLNCGSIIAVWMPRRLHQSNAKNHRTSSDLSEQTGLVFSFPIIIGGFNVQ